MPTTLFINLISGGLGTNANCKSYGKVSTFSATTTAPCSSPSVTVDMVSLTDALDDCYYSLDGANKKRYVKNKLNACKPDSGRRVLQSTAGAGDKNVMIQVSSVYDIHGSSNSSNNAGSTTTSPPVTSGGSSQKPAPATWLTSALLVLAAGV